ncbi:hypothetical protein V5094_12750 [Moellerella wisconsensis]|uniref:Uncharacterized protein n=2 Tax=Moellerella wisconsensis TaxID=158849 RepID=A0ACD3Y9K0_9GAMM|nr:hypothetical protein [Moellerella wisconsensis]UNH39498.1 hypothetical protein MNY70_03210 [Moellerella wisconsensis]
MRNFKCVTLAVLLSSGCSTKESDLCLFGMGSYFESHRDYSNPIYQDERGKELSWQARNELVKQADKYAKDSIDEDYVLAESLCPKLNTTDAIFETIHVDVDVRGKESNFFTVPFDYTGSQAAAVQLYNNSKKSYTSRMSGDLGGEGIAKMTVQGPCFNNICTEKDLVEFCKTKQRTALSDEKAIEQLKTYYIRDRGINITYPKKNKKIYSCKRPNWLRW